MLGYTNSNFCLLYKLRHCTAICSSVKAALQNCKKFFKMQKLKASALFTLETRNLQKGLHIEKITLKIQD